MILAGIDEAGYGPLLGPLVVGCCAFEVQASEGDPELPCLWKRLKRVAGKKRDGKGRKIHINDSKLVYSPSAGLKELERAVLTLCAANWEGCDCLEAVLERLGGPGRQELEGYQWYANFDGETFPIEQDGASVRVMANSLKAEMQANGAVCVHLGTRVLLERRLNEMLEQTRNKSSVLFSAAAQHLDYLLRTFGGRGLVIFCDRQGGREHYGHLLRVMFEDWSLEIAEEGDGRSEYRLARGEDQVRILFREKAETQCMPVAIASMLSKYVREALMRRFNAYWRMLLPELEPTAGYYSDGVRFLADIDLKRKEMGIEDAELIRSR